MNIRFVLVRTHHPGNIGASLRALVTLGFEDLWLVAPEQFPDGKARAMAADTAPLLEQVKVVPDLDSAIADCSLVIGTSARSRSVSWPELDCEETATKLAGHSGPAALVFGPEPSGLTSDELYRCQYRSYIPTHADYRSLNLSHAVQVYAWEIFQARRDIEADTQELSQDEGGATRKEIDALMAHCRDMLVGLDFPKRDPDHLMLRFLAIANRAGLQSDEVSMLRGLIRRVEERTGRQAG